MTVLPIVERELRVAARRRGTHANRLVAALLALLVGGFVMLSTGITRPSQMGMVLFVLLACLTLCYSILGGIMATSDCIAEEKREGTLGLLFLTDLRGYDIIAGKLAATSLNVFYSILAIFPVMAIPLLLGGVTAGEFWRVVLTATNNLFFSLAVGMWVSSVSRNERRAMLSCFLLLLFFTGGLPLLGGIVADQLRNPHLLLPFMVPSPGFAAFVSFDATRGVLRGLPPNQVYYFSVGCIHLMAWGFLCAASIIVPRTWQDKPASSKTGQRYGFWQRAGLGTTLSRPLIRQRLLGLNPFLWLAARDRLGIVWLWITLIGGGLIWTFGYLVNPKDWASHAAYVMIAISTHLVLRVWIASEACRRFAADRRSGALELILVTPLSVHEIIQGQLMALRRHFLWPIVLVLAADLAFMATDAKDGDWVAFWICGMSIFVADIFALAWVGMWCGLNSRDAGRALAATVVRILVLPIVIFLGFWLFLGFSGAIRYGGEGLFLGSWVVISIGSAAVFGITSYRRLHAEFRSIATRRFETKKQPPLTAASSPAAPPSPSVPPLPPPR